MIQANEQFGLWKVLEVGRLNGKEVCRCQCQCGTERTVDSYQLRKGYSQSCGCTRNNRLRHGHARKGKLSPEWQAWNHMHQRCYNPKDKHYQDYGGRGISVCDEWMTFDAFLSDMGLRPTGCSLDRIDGSGNYFPSNCRWADKYTQAQNRRTVILIEFNGQKRCVAEWSRLLGINRRTIQARYYKGWPTHEILRPITNDHNGTCP